MNCKIISCDRPHLAKGYCGKHYQQFRKYGQIMAFGRKETNPILIEGESAKVLLFSMKDRFNPKGFALIDKGDLPLIKDRSWHLTSSGYVQSQNNKKSVLMHSLISGHPMTDHINRIKTDNRRSNLRKADDILNNINKGLQKNNVSGHRGVCLIKSRTRRSGLRAYNLYWLAFISFKGKKVELGYFKDKEDAIKARKDAESKYFNEYSV